MLPLTVRTIACCHSSYKFATKNENDQRILLLSSWLAKNQTFFLTFVASLWADDVPRVFLLWSLPTACPGGRRSPPVSPFRRFPLPRALTALTQFVPIPLPNWFRLFCCCRLCGLLQFYFACDLVWTLPTCWCCLLEAVLPRSCCRRVRTTGNLTYSVEVELLEQDTDRNEH